VVSKMTTRSFSDFADVLMEMVLLALRPPDRSGVGARGVPGAFADPLSAQAQSPSRPSGADKQQEPAENEGGIRPGHRRAKRRRPSDGYDGPRDNRANGRARRHLPRNSLVFDRPRVAERS